VHRLAAVAVAALAGLVLALAPTAGATNKLQVGIFDDGAVLYGEPELIFPQLANTGTKLTSCSGSSWSFMYL